LQEKEPAMLIVGTVIAAVVVFAFATMRRDRAPPTDAAPLPA
jgi:hypothetical protein